MGNEREREREIIETGSEHAVGSIPFIKHILI